MWRGRGSLRLLTVGVGAATISSFALASYSVKVTFDERDLRIRENTARSSMNERVAQRGCERLNVIALAVIRLTQDPSIAAQLEVINARYPDIPACVIRT